MLVLSSTVSGGWRIRQVPNSGEDRFGLGVSIPSRLWSGALPHYT